jgi:hypothetical protein
MVDEDVAVAAFHNAKAHHRGDRDYLEQIKGEAEADVAAKRAMLFSELADKVNEEAIRLWLDEKAEPDSARLFDDFMKDVTSTGVHVRTALTTTNGRRLVRHDDKTAKTPFQYHGSALAQVRPDQVPRVLAALTESDELPTKELPFDALTAAQNRVDPDKVNAIAASGRFKKPAVVVHVGNGRNLILDGHHRLAAEWLLGRSTAVVRYKDVGRLSNALKSEDAGPVYLDGQKVADIVLGYIGRGASRPLEGSAYYEKVAKQVKVAKVDEGHGLVFGYAIVCKKDGQDYFDLQDDHIPEDAMLDASVDYMIKYRTAKEMHLPDGALPGSVVFAFPLTTDIAKAFGIETKTTGLMIGMKPDDPAVLAKFKSGEYTGFSMGGTRVTDEHVE